MSALYAIAWCAGLSLLLAWTVGAVRASRRDREAPVPRVFALAAAGLAAALCFGAIAVFGAGISARGLARITSGGSEVAPARARLFLRHVRLFAEPALGPAPVGYSPSARLRLPAFYDPQAADRGRDPLALLPIGAEDLFAFATPAASSGGAKVFLAAESEGDPRALADRLGRRCRRGKAPQARFAGGRGALVALLCRGRVPGAALVFARESSIRVTPLLWRAGRFVSHHVAIERGTLLQVGSLGAAVPGVPLWEVPAPPGSAQVFHAPEDLLAPCERWPGGGATAGRADAVCALPPSPPFSFEARRLLPDLGGAAARGAWIAGAVLAAPLFLLLSLAARPRGRLTRARFARALGLAWAAAILAAIGLARDLFAHRIDMLRDYEPFGSRVAANQSTMLLAAAALAAAAAVLAHPGRSRAGRERSRKPEVMRAPLVRAGLAWLAMIGCAGLAIYPIEPTLRLVGEALLSLLVGSAPAWVAPLRARLVSLPRPSLGGLGAVLLCAGFAACGALFFPRAVFLKLGLAWSAVPCFYVALRAAVRGDRGHPLGALAAGAICAGALSIFDPGITAALLLPGFALAVIFAAHDAVYGHPSPRSSGGRAGRGAAPIELDPPPGLPRERGRSQGAWASGGAPLARAHARLVLAASAAIALVALAGIAGGGGRDFPEELTRGAAIFLPLFAAALLLPVALLVSRRDAPRAAALWAAAALAAGCLAAGSGALADLAISSDTQAAHRLALVLEPGYALLRDEARFLAGTTAWRETALPAGADLLAGQGYFGAQLLDPGVLLSIDNDYLPVLAVRETGTLGLLLFISPILAAALGGFLLGRERFTGRAGGRVRLLLALLLGILAIYQPLAALGALPLTGVSLPGLGIDSAADFWVFFSLLGVFAFISETSASAPPQGSLRRRVRRLAIVAALAATAAAALLLVRASVFALKRPLSPVPAKEVRAAASYVESLRCEEGEHPVPSTLAGAPVDAVTARYHDSLLASFEAARPAAALAVDRFLAGEDCAGIDPDGAWRARGQAGREDVCELVFDAGWPEVELEIERRAGHAASVRCRVRADARPLRSKRKKEQSSRARVRLLSRPMGDASRDRGELSSGAYVVRLRPGAKSFEPPPAAGGAFVASEVRLAENLRVVAGDEGPVLEPLSPAPTLRIFERTPSGWRRRALSPGRTLAHRETLIALGATARAARTLWLLRPPRSFSPGEPPEVAPLLADDVTTVRGRRRRAYLYGSSLPQLGWRNRFDPDRSLGLDGWIHAAVEAAARAAPAAKPGSMCGTLEPDPIDLRRVCRADPGAVLACRVALQPELAIRLRHLTELAALRPDRFAGARAERATAASFALLRGDTGEIVAVGEHVAGRASPAYAPRTPALERRLIRLREDRDPETGVRLPAPERGEASAEKRELAVPVAAGSLLKPLFARALALADPIAAASFALTGTPQPGASCRGGRHALLGHCPPTDSLWNRTETLDLAGFLAHSANWYQAAIGLLGTAAGGGEAGFGDGAALPLWAIGLADVGAHPVGEALWTRAGGRDVIDAGGGVRPAALRQTPMWRRLEALLGRELCTLGGRRACRREADRRDLCAARALPIGSPSPDLRQLVALGPDRFDFYPARGAAPAERVSTLEYLQLLRGAAVHPLGSLPQLADAFGRVVYDAPDPESGAYRLAASWFPAPPIGRALPFGCEQGGGRPVRQGLCEVIRSGTAARALGPLLRDRRVILYGAKTGTLDTLADVAEDPKGCARWREGHTLTSKPRDQESQPYWLRCARRARGSVNDSLLLLAFGVRAEGRVVPLTLALRFERSGVGFAARVAPRYVDVIRDYFAPNAARGRP